MAALNVWMNGELVGEWSTLRTGTPVFRYAEAWTESPRARALSLSLPITADRELRGAIVDNYFENLLPDSIEIRRRMRTRFGARSLSPFDLLSAAGRDCVGAVQLLPPDLTPTGWDRIEATSLSHAQVEQELRRVVAPALGQTEDSDEEFRISLAGAQEKTALLYMAGKWFRPRGATPTTHMLKLPLGLIGGFRGDFTDSVENEWFCSQLLRELGLPVADSDIATFGTQKVLVVTRFDRRWIGVDPDAVAKRRFEPSKGQWIARLPQEDFCQATGMPPNQKYETDGGPSIEDGLSILAGSEDPEADKTTFVLAQLAFWLLAATDGHAKNFSLHHMSGGRYRMTPLYDVLSAWPIIGRGASQLAQPKVRLAMSLRSTRRHYKLDEIQNRHWQTLAARSAVPHLWDRMIELASAVDAALERVENRLPKAFPARVAASIAAGTRKQAKRFLAAELAD
jgi:serine/threonine-protein kinase HipA